MWIKVKAIILVITAAAAAFAVSSAAKTFRNAGDMLPQEVYARYAAKSGSAEYVIRSEDGHLAVYKRGKSRPEKVTDIESDSLRSADKAMLEKGISADDLDEVLSLLEDLGS